VEKIAKYAKLWLITGKSVLFAGAPGVGKTRLAKAVYTPYSYELVTGYEGLTFRDLILKLYSEGGIVKQEPGPILRAILKFYAYMVPVHIIFDEINRVNVETLLGPVFTALDIPHRMDIAVASIGDVEAVLNSGSHGLDEEGAEAIRKLLKVDRVKMIGGLPLPYATRFIATMNVYDASQLYRLGYALLRRFATIYVAPPHEGIEQKLNEDELSKAAKEVNSEWIVKSQGIFIQTAIRELLMHSEKPGILPSDRATIGDIDSYVKDASTRVVLGEASPLVRVLGYIYSKARELGFELGTSFIVDVIKLLIVVEALKDVWGLFIDDAELIDMVTASVLPQFHTVVPQVRLEAALGVSRRYEKLRDLANALMRVLGEKSMSARLAETLILWLPGV